MNLSDGEILLDQFKKLPDKAQQIFMAIISQAIYEDDMNSIKTLADIAIFVGFDFSKCESPIEVIFAFCYCYYLLRLPGMTYFELFSLVPQKEIKANGKTYRVDFAVDTDCDFYRCRTQNPVKVVFECDGHDFHEKTKEQVAKGNTRDYDLKIAGYEVIHFSGSQIYNCPIKCAREAVEFVIKKAGKIYE